MGEGDGEITTLVGTGAPHNWQPGVHTRFGEKLYFYLLRLKSPLRGDEVEDRIRRLLDAADISHACEYAVYGHWDVLIRVWLSPSWKKQFLTALREADDTSDVRYFEANELRYLWTGDSGDLLAHTPEVEATIAENLDDVRAVAEDEIDVDPEIRQRLFDAGLLFRRPVSEAADPVKFYICLEIYTDMPRKEEVARVLAALESAGLSDRASLYTGVGSFASHLIRCVANTYSEVMSLNAALSEGLKDLEVRPMTLLVANGCAQESDNINDLALLTPEDDVVLGLLELNERGPTLLAGIAPAQREALHRLVEEVYRRSIKEQKLRVKLRDLLRASLRNDFDSVRAQLFFLVDFEWFLGEYLKRAWSAVYGPDWIAPLANKFEQAGAKSDAALISKPEKWGLGDCVSLAIRSSELDNEVKLQLGKDLGPEWPHQMHTLKRIRNLVAHGGKLRKIPAFDEFTGEWGEILADLMTVASLHFKIERIMNKETDDQ
jgi:hypothetical protein